MIYFDALGTSCFDVYQLLNICIPTLTREVVKQRQKKSVTKNVQTALAKLDEVGAKIANYVSSFLAAPAYTA